MLRAVHIGARVAAAAEPGEILVTSAIRDAETGSGFGFEDRGSHALKGVDREWRLFRVTTLPEIEAPGAWERLRARTGTRRAAAVAVGGDLYPGAVSAAPEKLTPFGGNLLFAARSAAAGTELFLLDLTAPVSAITRFAPGAGVNEVVTGGTAADQPNTSCALWGSSALRATSPSRAGRRSNGPVKRAAARRRVARSPNDVSSPVEML